MKRFLEGLGFEVKGEIGGCDLVAIRGGEPPVVVIGELKLRFDLELVLQGVDRAAVGDEVWLAARWSSVAEGPGEGPEGPQALPAARLRTARRDRGGQVEIFVSPTAPTPRRDRGAGRGWSTKSSVVEATPWKAAAHERRS